MLPARVGLVGNPSDGYGGAVLATTVPGMSATVKATMADHVSFSAAETTTELGIGTSVVGRTPATSDTAMISGSSAPRCGSSSSTSASTEAAS